ncbi:hypothetical protein BDN72DRAFT_842096 [Pluteus cervinus]|uniref:Uncharacterized protein n=1 Tax=Pluteus cervinus TaxID=181527 RepID=A0ACD3ARL8_9AGAR|nr:hypothetical protein BDN72DRAFT_842096 [Pluteus cervinus]
MEDLATHFLLRLVPSLTPVGTIRGYKVPDTTYYKLTRLAVLKPYRRFRFGSVLVSVFHDWVQEDARIQLGQGKSSLTASTSTNRDVSHGGQHHGESAHDVLPLPSADGIISTIVSSSTQTNPTVNKIGTGSEVGERVVEIVCHSQIPVKGFYAKFGYEPVGDEFDEEGDPHQKMVLRLPY